MVSFHSASVKYGLPINSFAKEIFFLFFHMCVCVFEIGLIMIVDALEELLIRNGPFTITF